jgi:uncharacterized membrane protein YkvA (DUF1232 family)
MDMKARARDISRNLPALFLALGKRETPWTAKVLAALTVAYALSPIDLIPDFLPVIGYLDDLILLPLMIAATVRLIPVDVMARCRAEAKGLWDQATPKRWYFAIPILLLWVAVVGLLAWVVVRAATK